MPEKKSPLSKIGCLIPLISSGGIGCAILLILVFLAIAMFTTFFGGGQTGSTTAPTGTGSLAGAAIPAELKPIFEAAGAKYKLSPAFIAAIFWKEHGKNWPTKGPWASSPAGANGPFQFIECTWEGWGKCDRDGSFETDPKVLQKSGGYGQDGDGDSKADVQNLWDSSFAAGELLGKNGAAPNVTDLAVLRDCASRYNSGKPWSIGQGIPETANYVPDVIEMYQKLLKEL